MLHVRVQVITSTRQAFRSLWSLLVLRQARFPSPCRPWPGRCSAVQKPVWCLWVQPYPILRGCRARRYSGRCTPRADVWTRTVRAIACRREGVICEARLPRVLHSGGPVSARMTLLSPQVRRRRCALRDEPCASPVMWWRLSSQPTLVRSCCWRIWV